MISLDQIAAAFSSPVTVVSNNAGKVIAIIMLVIRIHITIKLIMQ